MPDFFFFLDLLDGGTTGAAGSVLRPGMVCTGVGMTKVSILKLLMSENPEAAGGPRPGM